jgi:hypothetical protein
MPPANRYFLPGYIWHITHRCHKKEFLLKFSKDRERWISWLFRASKRYRSIDTSSLMKIVGIQDIEAFQKQHQQWLNNETFIDAVHTLLGFKSRKRKKTVFAEKHVLRKTPELYSVDFDSQVGSLSLNNQLFWDNMCV